MISAACTEKQKTKREIADTDIVVFMSGNHPDVYNQIMNTILTKNQGLEMTIKENIAEINNQSRYFMVIKQIKYDKKMLLKYDKLGVDWKDLWHRLHKHLTNSQINSLERQVLTLGFK